MKKFFNACDVNVGYNENLVVKDINIFLQKGKILTIIGANGSGKSTILKSIAGHIKLIGGNIWIGEKNMLSMSSNEIAKKLSVVFTQRPYTEKLSCEDVVSIGRYPYTGKFGFLTDKDKEKVYDAMQIINILDLRQKDFNEISDGQRQRVLLASALCQEPEIILLDEPTMFLDIKYKIELLSILNMMAYEKNISIILTLHELDLVQKISDFVVCVKNGRIEKQGTSDEVFTEDYINWLYDITEGSYNDKFGCVELKANKQKPEIFVIAGGGTGINIFRKLHRKKIPFAVGVLHENDIDYELAKYIADEVIKEEMFEKIGKEKIELSKKIIKDCKKVICCVKKFGIMNIENYELIEYAKMLNIDVVML